MAAIGHYWKKIKGVFEEVIGTATVVCPEVVVNKKWDPNVDYINKAMKVPSETFYDYLGPYICPDEALKDGYFYNEAGANTYGFGYGQDPYNNDLGIAMDKKVFSSPAPIAMAVDRTDELKKIGRWESKITGKMTANKATDDSSNIYRKVDEVLATYQWDGDWGDIENGFQTGATFQVVMSAINERANGGLFGNRTPTGSYAFLCMGSEGDESTQGFNSGLRLATGPDSNGSTSPNPGSAWKLFYNPHFSTGRNKFGNGSVHTQLWFVNVNRKPFENAILIRGVIACRGGKYEFIPSGIGCSDPCISVGPFGVCLPICGIINFLFGAIISIINKLISIIFSQDESYAASVTMQVDATSRTYTTIDKKEYMEHPAQKNFYPKDFFPTAMNPTTKEYLYTQFIYPSIMKNPLFAFTDTFNFREPYLNNMVVENKMYNDRVQLNHPLLKKYKYFVPSLFSLLYETNIGIFYEQLIQQLKNKGIPESYNIKIGPIPSNSGFTDDYQTVPDHNTPRATQDPTITDLIFPTNFDVWNDLIENTGWTATGKSDDTAFLGKFISGASVPSSGPGSGVPGDYMTALSDHGIPTPGSIADVDKIIGEFAFIKGEVEANGANLEMWTTSVDNNCFELSTGSPKNLALKLAQFIVWYLEPNGIADQTRLSARSLVDYEKFMNEEIDEYRKAGNAIGGLSVGDWHIIGTEKYARNCT